MLKFSASNMWPQDKAARLFVYRGDMYAEWLAYGNDAKRITESFTAGINAYIEVAKANPELMPGGIRHAGLHAKQMVGR